MREINPNHDRDTDAEFHRRVKENTKRIIKYVDEPGPNDSRSGLKQLFRKIIDDLSINERKWRRYMEAYLSDPINGIPNNTEKHVQERSALNKNVLTNEQMTWKVFIRALRFIRVKQFRFAVTLVHSNDTTTEHGLWFNLRNSYTPLKEDDDPRTTLNRVPVVEIRDDSQSPGAVDAYESSGRASIQAPPPIDFGKYRREYPVIGQPPPIE